MRFIADQNILTGEKFKNTEIGGLSGIIYDSEKKHLLAISDDKSIVQDARIYDFELSIDESSLKITPVEVITLKARDGKPFPKGSIDPEGIAILNGDFYISSEGALNKEKAINPELIRFKRDGSYISNIEIPSKFLYNKDKPTTYGLRDNLAFEALNTLSDGNFIFLGAEEALLQDDRISTPNYSSVTRIIKYKDEKVIKEFGYKLDNVPNITVAGLVVGETGLVDFIFIDENTFYSIERAYMPLAKKSVIKIFKCRISDKTTDLSNLESIKDQKITTVEKELISNLDDFLTKMSPNFQTLDNIEGIAFGPILKNKHQSIILMSDNNFNKKQRTQILAFEIEP